MVSQRTKEALCRKRAEGVILGRPLGKKSSRVKLSGYENEIKKLLAKNISKNAIARLFGVHRITLYTFLKERM